MSKEFILKSITYKQREGSAILVLHEINGRGVVEVEDVPIAKAPSFTLGELYAPEDILAG